ncbi:MAG: hypothetical protein ACT4PE_13880 [Candidatus Eiseniibacteriota bacterium]
MRCGLAAPLAAVLLGFVPASAQTFPMTSGTLEVQFGLGAVMLPEGSDGTYSAQPELRLGLFLMPGFELQVQGDARLWPLGSVAAKSYGASAQVLWFPRLSPENRNFYLMAGGGGALNDPPARTGLDSGFDPLLRGGLGYKVPLTGLDFAFLKQSHLTIEGRLEALFQDETDLVSGGAIALSYFL